MPGQGAGPRQAPDRRNAPRSGWRAAATQSAVPHTPAARRPPVTEPGAPVRGTASLRAARRERHSPRNRGRGAGGGRSASLAPRDRPPHVNVSPAAKATPAPPFPAPPPLRGPGKAALPSFPHSRTPSLAPRRLAADTSAAGGAPAPELRWRRGRMGRVSGPATATPAAGEGTTREGERRRRELTGAHGAEQHPSSQQPHGGAARQPGGLRSWSPQRAGGRALPRRGRGGARRSGEEGASSRR